MESGEIKKDRGSRALAEEQTTEPDFDVEVKDGRSDRDAKKWSVNKPPSDKSSEEQEVKMSLKRKLGGEKSQQSPEKKTKIKDDKKIDEDEASDKDDVAEPELVDGDENVDLPVTVVHKGEGMREKEEKQQQSDDAWETEELTEEKEEADTLLCEDENALAKRGAGETKTGCGGDLNVSKETTEMPTVEKDGETDTNNSGEDDVEDLSLNNKSKSGERLPKDKDTDVPEDKEHTLPVSKSVASEGKSENSKDMPEESQSVKSDGSSDKENVNCEVPMDLSNSGTPDADVIMLSDEDEPLQGSKRPKEEPRKYFQRVKRLQAELRNEEAKLVLLKKLRQSQLAPQIQEHPPVVGSGTTPNSSQLKPSIPRQQGGPPPLVKGGQIQGRSSGMHLPQQQQPPQQQQHSRSAVQGQSRNVQGPPPLIGASRSNTSASNGHGLQNITSIRGLMPGISQITPSSHRSLQQQQQPQASTPPQPAGDNTQTPAQRQAAAKLALRKQLEKTLLQIPPPKPPAPEMNFIPSLACPDFVLLLGLEEVVNHIVDLQLIARGQKSADEKFICNPFTCVQCGTDYTPVWKREKPGSKNVICEHCVTWNQKRALKQEHTNRLKSAFVKALQQEQEIERMQAHCLTSPSPPMPSATPPAPPLVTAPPQALAAAANSVAAVASISLSPASFRTSAEQARQHHSFLQAQQMRAAQPLGIPGFGGRPPFPYGLHYPNIKQADLQRQYLLDMIPRATSGMPWKH
ncbi:transcriptional repressor p66 alpha-like [Pomacea canaliculata]|nr:transcriptional repressor p66 alpha-like [Pomacea canaliculata]XP_025078311.1 transcriptional repressor p66 alpha-like [Pomacea canaliculata]